MSAINQTTSQVQEFIILGFPGMRDQESRKILFAVFLAMYIFILLGNFLLIFIFISDRNLHTPMYVLVCGLAILDLVISTNTVPSMLVVFKLESRIASFAACFTQTMFWLSLYSTESFILTLMAYDRYMAICNPLHYPNIMNNSRILKLMVCCWVGGFLSATPGIAYTLTFSFCGSNKVNHCFCDYSSVLALACGNIMIASYYGLAVGLSVLVFSLMYILYSYMRIISSVLKIASIDGRLKAFYTCGTHLLVISVFFFVAGGVFISYRIPGTSVDMRIMGAIFQNVFPALMNPVIYCLRTKEIRDSFVKTLRKTRVLPKRI
ncbi:olfactory receptor 10A3-like [Erpetoichthys calabaricus]|uniref:olfactory receptor 10A3-like n=1 Tax=Erpetoichthys calabaricus TaxID=27687 RepID=UPI002234A1D9|nr:olfactory receptor 10A3-like [Erpetoichthys calabaricus]